MAEAGEFSLIIENVDKEQLSDAAVQFAAAFSLDATLAQQICKSAPIVFAQKLTKAEVKAVTPRLKELSNAGLEFRVTARVAGKMPKVNWPVRPQFTAGDSGGPNGLAFEWENSAFVCPSCGETYLFRRMGKLQLAEPEASAATEAPPVETVETLREDLMSFNEPAPAAEPAPLAEVPDVAPSMEAAESGPAGDIELQPEPVADAPMEPDLQPLEEAEPAPEPAAEAAAEVPLPMEETSIDEPGGAFTAAAEEAQAAPPAPAPEPEPEEEEDEGGEKFNVFLSKITDSAKRKKAIELIAKVKKCSDGEAKELTTRLVIPLAKNVSKKKAESILGSFKKLKIFGRMTKVK